MQQGRITIITGAPGTGKTTVAAAIARLSPLDKSAHMHTDDFYHYLSKGVVPPHLPGADEQNAVVVEAIRDAAMRYACGGYDVVVDGIIGPWFLAPWMEAARQGYEVHYLVLRASKNETLRRATSRAKLGRQTNLELVEAMWGQFADLGPYEPHVVDTTKLTIAQATDRVMRRIEAGDCLLKP